METRRIADLIDRVMNGDPWHGPNVAATLDGVSAAAAARRPPGGTHSMWELVLHMTGWAREVTARLDGRAAQEPDGGDWPAVTAIGEDAWQAARTALFAAHDDLARVVRGVGDETLEQPVRDFRDNALGTGLSRYLTLHGLIQHTCYHAGQLAMLRRLLG
jgi:hypothetical protein